MDVAFGVLSVIGVAIQLFETIKASYELLSTAKGLEKDAPILLWKLKIQQARFVSWGQYFGAESGVLDAQLRENGLSSLVVGLLQQTKQMLSHADTLVSKYGVHCPAGSFPLLPTGSAAARQTIPLLKASISFKLRWAISDKAKFASLIADLKDFNDGLYAVLRINETVAIDRLIHSAVLRGTRNAS